MKRHPALHDLSRDHHLLLLQARAIRWTVEGVARAAPVADVLADLRHFWVREGLLHLWEEEAIIFPRLARVPPEAEGVAHLARLSADHAWLKAAVLALPPVPEAATLAALAAFGQRLHDHIRFEERVVYQGLQMWLTEAEMAEIGAASVAFRRVHRGEGAIGPRGDG